MVIQALAALGPRAIDFVLEAFVTTTEEKT
ncbi:MAG: hypothetical protein RL707_1161 [Pseudomonadota bacterium]|jgi:hypothetical protein